MPKTEHRTAFPLFAVLVSCHRQRLRRNTVRSFAETVLALRPHRRPRAALRRLKRESNRFTTPSTTTAFSDSAVLAGLRREDLFLSLPGHSVVVVTGWFTVAGVLTAYLSTF